MTETSNREKRSKQRYVSTVSELFYKRRRSPSIRRCHTFLWKLPFSLYNLKVVGVVDELPNQPKWNLDGLVGLRDLVNERLTCLWNFMSQFCPLKSLTTKT